MQPAPVNDQLSGLSSQQAAQLDDVSLSTLRSLSSLCREFRQSTSATQRIQRGSPGAGQLGPVIRIHQSKFSTIAGQCQQIFTRHSRFPGVNLLQTRLNELQQTLGAGFDDTSTGYAQRVHVLEKLNYENGTVRGVVDTIIEQHEYQWKNKLPGQGNQQPVARRLAFSDSSQNQPAALSTSNQLLQLGQISPPKLPKSSPKLIKLSVASPALQVTQQQLLGSDSQSSTVTTSVYVPRPFKPSPLPTTASGVQASISSTRPSPLGSSQLGLGSGGPVFPPMSSGALALGPPPSLSRSRFQDNSGQQFGLSPSGTGLALKTSSLFQSLPSTTSSTTVTHPSGVAPLPSVSSTGLGGPSVQLAITTVQAQISGGLFGSQSTQNLISRGLKSSQMGIGTSSSSQNQLSSQPAQAQAPAQTGGGFGTPPQFKTADLALGGSGFGSGLSGQAGGLQLGSAGFGGLGGGLRLDQQGSSPFVFGSATTHTTQAQSQRSFGPPPSAAGINFSAPRPIQAIPNQPSSSSTIVTPSQPSVSADLGTARTTTNILYIPRQPMNRAGGSNNTGQESVASNDENAEEQSSSQKQSFSLSVDQAIHICNGITDLWDSKRHADVTFLVQGTRVTAHRIILASQSQYFDRLLFGEMREAREDEIQLSDVENVEAFQMLMQYAYSGCVDIQNGDIQDALDMLKLSDQFGFELLKDTLGEKLIVEINMENILHLLAYADLYQVTGLLDECCAFIDQHAGDVLRSDAILIVNDHVLKVILSRDSLCIEEIIILQTVVRWKKNNKMNKEEMKGVLDCVRLTEIPPRILFGEVEKSCLFESESIMKALRVQNLSDFEQMRPRGRKCTGINLMADATIDISTSGTSTSSSTDGVVFLNTPQPHISAGMHLSRFSPCESLVRVTLEQEYLVNTIELEDRPTRANWQRYIHRDDNIIGVHNIQNETFSYKIYVSRDGKDWKDVFDYSHHSCHSVQKLYFPPLVFRMFQFELTGSRCNSHLQLKFLKCSFEEDIKPFKFRERGIIGTQQKQVEHTNLIWVNCLSCTAPLFPLKPKAYQTKGVRPETIVVNFSQPYSISMLSFRICGPINSVADITVSNCLVAESAHLTAHPFNEQLSIEFPEQTVTTITVEIRNVMSSTNGPPGSVGTSTALPVSGEADSSQLVDNKSQNSAQASARIPADSGVRGAGNQRRQRGNQVDELKYKIAGLTCQLLLPEE